MPLMQNLLNLFRVDGQVRGLRSRLVSAEKFLAGQEAKLGGLTAQQIELEMRLRQAQAKARVEETEIASTGERLERLRTELNSAGTNKQYTALLAEVNTLKGVRSEHETAALREMEQVDRLTKEVDEVKVQIAERAKQRDQAKAQLAERKADISDRLAELETERTMAAQSISPENLRLFEELADIYEGEALAALEVVDKRSREYACGSCNMHVPFEAVSVLCASKDNVLVRCSVCKRILFMQDETRGSLAKK